MAISRFSGPVEHRGAAKICPNPLFINLFQPGGADYDHPIGLTLPTFKPFCQASVQLTNNITTRQTKLKSLQLDLKLGSA